MKRFAKLLVAAAALLALVLLVGCTDVQPMSTTAAEPPVTDPAHTTVGTKNVAVNLLISDTRNVVCSSQTTAITKEGGQVTFRVAAANEGDELSFACDNDTPYTYDEEAGKLTVTFVREVTNITVTAVKKQFTVSAAPGEHFTLSGDATVEWGGKVTLSLTPERGYIIESVSEGAYNPTAGTLTLSNVKSDVVVTVRTAPRASDWVVSLIGSHFSTSDGKTSVSVKEGGNATFSFTLAAGYLLVDVKGATCTEEGGVYTVTVQNVTDDVRIEITTALPAFVYHLNDGTEATLRQDVDLSFYRAPNTKWDDGKLSREGYVLLEYNTKADGTGEAYSLGSKVVYDTTKATMDLFCIWAPETPTGDFSFAEIKVNKVVTAYKITSYRGNAATVVIPTAYKGKPVTSIASGAFQNKDVKTLVLSKSLTEVSAGAFAHCSLLQTLYLSDSIASIPDEAFDSDTYANLHHLYLNATTASRYSYDTNGMYRVKWDHVMWSKAQGRRVIVVVAGSSAAFGFSAEYMAALMGEGYDVVNFGTICTTAGTLYLEALSTLLDENDIVIWAPESSTAYQMGSGVMDTFKIFRDTEGMNNVFRCVDIAHFSHYFAGLTDFNGNRKSMSARDYDGYNAQCASAASTSTSKDFDGTYPDTVKGVYTDYWGNTIIGSYYNYWGDLIAGTAKNTAKNTTNSGHNISFNGKVTSEVINGSTISGSEITDYAHLAKACIKALTDNGTKVFFGFCPVNEKALIDGANTPAQQAAYDALIASTYGIPVLGSCTDHVFDNSLMSGADTHHLTDRGRQIHTWRLYLELCSKLEIVPKTEAQAKAAAQAAKIPGVAW